MTPIAKSSVPAIQRLVNDPYGDYATPDYCYGFMDTAQKMLFNEMLAMPVIGRPMAIIVVPSIGVGVRSLHSLFDASSSPPGVFSQVEEIRSLKERSTTATSEADWRRMTPTYDIAGMTSGSYNHIYQFTGDDLLLPGADQDLQLRLFGSVRPEAITGENSPLIPSTDVIIEFRAAGLICATRGNVRLQNLYLGAAPGMGLANEQQQAYIQRIVQQLQETPVRQKSFSGRVRSTL